MSARSLIKIIRSHDTADGDGVRIKRLALFNEPLADPFLMLDQLSSDNPNDFIGGFPPHPHRGMETLTYLRQGSLEHQDHMGNRGMIHSGGAQWMSAARGVIHSEMPAREMQQLFGWQLWINLPAAQKMQDPDYRDVEANEIPVLKTAHATSKAIGGSWHIDQQPLSGPLSNLAAQAGYLDVELDAQGKITIENPQERVLVLVYQGQLDVHEQASERHLLIFGAGQSLELSSSNGAKFLVLAGTPIKEPVVHYGPFVMNSMEEIHQAIDDYNSGKLAAPNETR